MKKTRTSKLPQIEVKRTYETAIQCRDYASAKTVINDTADKYNLSTNTVNEMLNDFAKKNNMKTVYGYITEKKISELSTLIANNPGNIRQCCREYVKKVYPELTERDKVVEFEREVKRAQNFWNFHRNNSHVCFMTVSKKGKAIINGKNSSNVNSNYSKGFFHSLGMRVRALFKNTF